MFFCPMFVYMIIPVEKSGFNPIHLSFIELWIACNTVLAMFIDQGWPGLTIFFWDTPGSTLDQNPAFSAGFHQSPPKPPIRLVPQKIPRKWEPEIKRDAHNARN